MASKLFGQHHPASLVGVRDAMELGSMKDGIEARLALRPWTWSACFMLLGDVEVILVDTRRVCAYTRGTRHENIPSHTFRVRSVGSHAHHCKLPTPCRRLDMVCSGLSTLIWYRVIASQVF
jgi:hypothetical protein